MSKFTLADLEKRVHERAKASAAESYTRALLDKGVAQCAKKLGEEAIETVLAALQDDKGKLIAEAADLLYHLLVVLEARGVTLAEVEAALEKRTAQTGHEEKASRKRVEVISLMEQRTNDMLSPYRTFTRAQWAALRADAPMTLTKDEVTQACARCTTGSTWRRWRRSICRCRGCCRCMWRRRSACSSRSSASSPPKTPRCLTSSASPARWRSANRPPRACCRRCLARWPNVPKVDLITTDGFLYPNAILEREGLMEKKGFPESYDLPALLRFLTDVKAGRQPARAPIYSHLVYDVMPNQSIEIDRPDILIVEGLERAANRAAAEGRQGDPVRVGLLRFLGLSRRRRGRAQGHGTSTAFSRCAAPRSAIRNPTSTAIRICPTMKRWKPPSSIWERINLVNLHENILPTRQRADLILKKVESHQVEEVSLRRL